MAKRYNNRQPSGFGAGPGGECICPKCERTVFHVTGDPCYKVQCPDCGTSMTRKRY